MKKKLACMLLMSALALSMTACGGKNSDSDPDYIKDKGPLGVGTPDFDPMDYKDDNGRCKGESSKCLM